MNSDSEKEDLVYFNKYKIEKKLGQGSFGVIYSAVDITTNERYALKIVKNYLMLVYK